MTQKILTEKPTVMKPMLRFDCIKLHTDVKYDYFMLPLSKYKLAELRELYVNDKEDKGFLFKLGSYVISDDDIILFGKSDETSHKVELKLEKIIVSKESVLCVPAEINLKNLTFSNKITPGVDAFRVYQYNVGLLGNPDNLIIFRELISYKKANGK